MVRQLRGRGNPYSLLLGCLARCGRSPISVMGSSVFVILCQPVDLHGRRDQYYRTRARHNPSLLDRVLQAPLLRMSNCVDPLLPFLRPRPIYVRRCRVDSSDHGRCQRRRSLGSGANGSRITIPSRSTSSTCANDQWEPRRHFPDTAMPAHCTNH